MIKNGKVLLRVPDSINDLLKLISDNNPKSENNKTDTAYNLLVFGTAFFLKQFTPKNIDDFKKNIKVLKIHNEMTFLPLIIKFYNNNKLKGGQKDE